MRHEGVVKTWTAQPDAQCTTVQAGRFESQLCSLWPTPVHRIEWDRALGDQIAQSATAAYRKVGTIDQVGAACSCCVDLDAEYRWRQEWAGSLQSLVGPEVVQAVQQAATRVRPGSAVDVAKSRVFVVEYGSVQVMELGAQEGGMLDVCMRLCMHACMYRAWCSDVVSVVRLSDAAYATGSHCAGGTGCGRHYQVPSSHLSAPTWHWCCGCEVWVLEG